eukprot:gene25727-31101_t
MSWFRRATGSAPKPAPPQNGVVGGSRPPNPFLQGAGDGASAEQQLALRNLQMMLYKFKSLPTEREKAAALRPLLQLFASIYEAADAYDMTKQLGKAEVYELSFHTSRCLVMEIKVRASDQSTEVAAQSLADFLSQDGEFGALAIQVLTLLASKSEDIVMPMAEMTLPSTLVKTLFLFFDLPTPNSALRKVSWGRMHARLSKLLGSLAASPIVAKELVKAEDLSRLFDMLYSEVPAHNAMWRDISGVTLRSLFAKGMCDAAICDIRATGCVPRSLAALRHVKGFSAAAIANVLLTFEKTWASEDPGVFVSISKTVSRLVYCGLLTFKPNAEPVTN